MTELGTQTIKVQHGCGCLSGCGTLLAIILLLTGLDDAKRWVDQNMGLALVLLAVVIVLLSAFYYLYVKPKQQAEAAGAAVTKADPGPSEEPDTKQCPECAETIKAAARVCRFCRHRFDGA